jgi:hypothetical protein
VLRLYEAFDGHVCVCFHNNGSGVAVYATNLFKYAGRGDMLIDIALLYRPLAYHIIDLMILSSHTLSKIVMND